MRQRALLNSWLDWPDRRWWYFYIVFCGSHVLASPVEQRFPSLAMATAGPSVIPSEHGKRQAFVYECAIEATDWGLLASRPPGENRYQWQIQIQQTIVERALAESSRAIAPGMRSTLFKGLHLVESRSLEGSVDECLN